jgi:hypothetical protein
MSRLNRNIAIFVILAALMLMGVIPAFAGAEGRKNSAMALTAATLYAALQKNKTPAVLLALGSAQAWKEYGDASKREQARSRYANNRRDYYGGRTYSRPYNSNQRSYSTYPSRSYRTTSYTRQGHETDPSRGYVRCADQSHGQSRNHNHRSHD